MGPALTRANDERLLAMLALRCAGHSTRAIAARYSVDFGHVARSTDAVAKADLAESGEPAPRVARAYDWPRRTAKGATDAPR